VLQIIPDLDEGPGARATIDAAAALSRVGAHALVACRGGLMVSELQAKGGVFIPFPAHARNPLAMALNIARLARLIKGEGVDIAHARSRAPAWVAHGATRLTKTPLVTSFPGRYAGGNALEARYNSILARGDVVIADSEYAAKLIAKLYPATKGKVHTVRRGVKCKIFAPNAIAPARVQAVRREWRVDAEEPVVLMAADLGVFGGPKLFIEAARILRAQGLAGVKFILAGETRSRSLAAEIDRAIMRAGLQDMARRVGRCGDMPAALLAASVVAAPSMRPGDFAGFAVEAQAMGTPVVVSDLGGAAEAVLAPPEIDASLRTGWRTPAGEATAFAAAVKEALELGAAARDRLALRARRHVEADFSIEQICAQTLDAYAACLPGRED
jgi:glycosyltransferase involved in cell wall biosynthesis